jgi:intracellular sulfur oxidation DsrE/DsrF family protein
MPNSSSPLPRRRFLGGLALAGAALASPATLEALPVEELRDDADWDHSWLKRLKARHRTFFDTAAWNGGDAFGYPGRYLDAMRDGYGAAPAAVQVVIGFHGNTWPLALDDDRWSRYQLGKIVGVDDPATKARALRNVARSDAVGEPFAAASLVGMQKRGATILVCNNTLRRNSREIAAAMEGGDAEKVYADFRAGVLPEVIVVPAMVAAIALAQERGCSYIG